MTQNCELQCQNASGGLCSTGIDLTAIVWDPSQIDSCVSV